MLKSLWNILSKGSGKMDSNYFILRRVTLGGFNRKDVISYIEKIKNEFADYKSKAEKTIAELQAEVQALKAQAVQLNEKPEASAEQEKQETEAEETQAEETPTQCEESIVDVLCNNNASANEKVKAEECEEKSIKELIYETIKNFSFDYNSEDAQAGAPNQKNNAGVSVLDSISTFAF